MRTSAWPSGVRDVDRDRALVAVGAEVVGGLGGVAAVARPCRKGGPQPRVSSPPGWPSPGGRSTLITSAPRSASVWVHHGPASTRDRSRTRTPASACGAAGRSVDRRSRWRRPSADCGRVVRRRGIGIIDAMSLASGWRARALPSLSLLAALIACSPTLDWREARPEGSGVAALFPCRPDQHERTVRIAGADAADATARLRRRAARPSRSPSSTAPSRPGSQPLLAALQASARRQHRRRRAARRAVARRPGRRRTRRARCSHLRAGCPTAGRSPRTPPSSSTGVRVYQATAIGAALPRGRHPDLLRRDQAPAMNVYRSGRRPR